MPAKGFRAKVKEIKAEDSANSQYDQLGEGWGYLISLFRVFPDMLLDILRAEDADYELTMIQRIFMRSKARYQYCDITACRGATKSYCSEGEEVVELVVWPGTRCAYFGPSFTQTARIGSEIYNEFSRNYPALAAHCTVMSQTKDSFELATPYGSNFSITAMRGVTCHKSVAEEYAQENPPPFDNETYKRVVLPAVRADYRVNGRLDPAYIPFKQHFITSAGRRQNHSYEERERHLAMMQRGDRAAIVMDVPFDVILLLGMRPVAWAERLKNELTPDEWAREMESRYTGSDQNPVIRDETLTDSRQLLMMEEHHCCKDADCREKPEDVIYVVGYDVSYADGAQNAKCAAVVLKLTKQTFFLKRDKYMKHAVWIDDWAPMDPMGQARRLKSLWYRFCYEGSQTYIAIDAWQYGTAVLQALMMDLADGLAPLCVMDHAAFREFELEGAVPVIYPIKAGGATSTDPDAEMVRYAELQFENRNVQILTSNYQNGMDAYKKFHRIKDDRNDSIIFRPYQKTQELIGQIQNLKKVPSGAGMSEKRISNKIQRDSWSALKYALRLAQKLELKNLVKEKKQSAWEAAYKAQRHIASTATRMRGIGRTGGRRSF